MVKVVRVVAFVAAGAVAGYFLGNMAGIEATLAVLIGGGVAFFLSLFVGYGIITFGAAAAGYYFLGFVGAVAGFLGGLIVEIVLERIVGEEEGVLSA